MQHPRYRQEELAARLLEIYPEVRARGITVALEYDHEGKAWVVTFSRGGHRLRTLLERKDADACMEGVQCVYLGVQIAQLIKDFEGP